MQDYLQQILWVASKERKGNISLEMLGVCFENYVNLKDIQCFFFKHSCLILDT